MYCFIFHCPNNKRGWDKTNKPGHKDEQVLSMFLLPLMISCKTSLFEGVFVLHANQPLERDNI